MSQFTSTGAIGKLTKKDEIAVERMKPLLRSGCFLQTSVTGYHHCPLRIVPGWGTKVVDQFPLELELIMWPVIINGFGMVYVNACVCVVPLSSTVVGIWIMLSGKSMYLI